MLTKKIVNIKGVRVFYLEEKRASQDLLIFLHGWGQDSNSLIGLARHFKKASFVLFDLPGFGMSEIKKGGMRVSEYADIIQEFISKRTEKRIVLIGHSFGGRIIIDLCSRQPKNIHSAILLSSGGVEEKSLYVRFLAYMSKLYNKIFANLKIKKILSKIFIKEPDAINSFNNPDIRETFKLVVSEDLREKARKISAPCYLFWGKEDKTTPVSHAKALNKCIAGSKLYLFPGNHFFFQKESKSIHEKINLVLS